MSDETPNASSATAPGALKRCWRALRKPSVKYSFIGIASLFFVLGIIFWGGFNTGLEATNTLEFCISCHEMRDNVYQEYKLPIQSRTPARRHMHQPPQVLKAPPELCHLRHPPSSPIIHCLPASRITHHVSRITHHVSRITHHAPLLAFFHHRHPAPLLRQPPLHHVRITVPSQLERVRRP